MSSHDLSASFNSFAEHKQDAAIQVICLGSGGGPSEDNVSGYLVRSAASGWVRGSILAVDAGTHLSGITRILERHLPAVSREQVRADSDGNLLPAAEALTPQRLAQPTSSPPSSPLSRPPKKLEPIVLENGPFAGMPLPHASARANSAHIVRSHVATYLISHPHLDHLAGFVMNTPAFHATSRPKTLAALPFTVEAIKKHIFNDVIWPNLSDEDGGVGFVTFQRLKEGGDVMIGEGEGRGYIEVCEGLSTKPFKISHGKCAGTSESHRGSLSNLSDVPAGYSMTPKPFSHLHHPGTPGSYAGQNVSQNTSHPFQQQQPQQDSSVVDSTVYFIRDLATHREIMIFGDVEPDSISAVPRLARVWAEAAPKIAAGVLTGIFIECSYADSQADAILFGHFAPRHLIVELQTLGEMVREERAMRASEKAMRKRKRLNGGVAGSFEDLEQHSLDQKRSRSLVGRNAAFNAGRRSSAPTPDEAPFEAPSPRSTPVRGMPSSVDGVAHLRYRTVPLPVPAVEGAAQALNQDPLLPGLKVMITHIKDTMKDGPHISEVILQQLNEHVEDLAQAGVKLGCQFEIAEAGSDYWF